MSLTFKLPSVLSKNTCHLFVLAVENVSDEFLSTSVVSSLNSDPKFVADFMCMPVNPAVIAGANIAVKVETDRMRMDRQQESEGFRATVDLSKQRQQQQNRPPPPQKGKSK